ncbi:hypothetical protein M433DRAFT_177271 [Acidomyces richmondensis BFW]|nr:hypothetical protein M433DRAFT_177271 [Acidomyces richmondensis BFW]
MAQAKILFLALFVAAVAALPGHGTDPALFCSIVDKFVSAERTQSSATAFCSSYLSIPVVTSTSSITPQVMTTTTVTTLYVNPPQITTTTTIINTITPQAVTATITATEGTTTITSTASTCPVLPTPVVKAKRESSPWPKPPCFSSWADGAALSSACKCLSIPTSTRILITTLSTPTSTVVSTSVVTNPVQTQTVTSTMITTLAQQTVTSTSTVQATSTFVGLAEATCTSFNFPTEGGAGDNQGIDILYTEYFAGCNVQLSSDSPAGGVLFTDFYPGLYSACDAIQLCAANAANGPDERSFVMYYVTATNEWQCDYYEYENTNTSYFISDLGVREVFAYSATYPGYHGPGCPPYSHDSVSSSSSSDC